MLQPLIFCIISAIILSFVMFLLAFWIIASIYKYSQSFSSQTFELIEELLFYMKTIQEIFPRFSKAESYRSSYGDLFPVTHAFDKGSQKDLVTSMKYILEQIQNIKQEVVKDKFDSFIDKTMLVSSQKENSCIDFSKKCIKNELTFSKNAKPRLKKKIETNVYLPLAQTKRNEEKVASRIRKCSILYPISCSNINNPPTRSQWEISSLVNSRTLQRSRIVNFVQPVVASPLKIQDFELGQLIGSGKFGDVHACRHRITNWIFALKKVLKSTILQYNMLNLFINELKIQYRLDHPNIIKLYAHFSDQYHVFLLMEYAPAGTLMKHLKSSQDYTANALQQSLEAIRYSHMNHVIHRDIKPENIVVFFNDTFKLCDFGLSTYLSPLHDVKTSFCGTLDYMAPQMKDVGLYDYSIDIWGLGILTYELLIGEAPFKEEISNWKKRGGQKSNSWNWRIIYPAELSENAIAFMKNLLKENPNERVSITSALSSKFIKERKKENEHLAEYELNFLSLG